MQSLKFGGVEGDRHNRRTLHSGTRGAPQNNPGERMCELLKKQDPGHFKQTSRSVRISGLSTSVRLEVAFWEMLDDIALHECLSVPRLIAVLHDEALDRHGEVTNLASLLRTVCLLYQAQYSERAIERQPQV